MIVFHFLIEKTINHRFLFLDNINKIAFSIFLILLVSRAENNESKKIILR